MGNQKIIRDPIHDVISFDARKDRIVIDLLKTVTLQRLRNIRQMGFAWVAFPGAEHSRFTHSLGACHLAGRLLDSLDRTHDIAPDDRTAAMVGALLHDIGHGPFSHLYESVFPDARSHEAWGVDIITNPETDIYRLLARYDSALPQRIADVLRKKYRPLYVVQIVSSQLDVDRFDYLLRDSRMTGAQYGQFDIEWLLHSMTLTDIEAGARVERSLAVDAGRGLHTLEQHLLGRHYMYRQVYFHPTCRSADALAKSVFRRLTQIEPPSDTPPGLRAAAAGRQPSLEDYLDLDDFLLLGLFRQWGKHASDPVLRDLCRRLTTRNLFLTVDWSECDEEQLTRRIEAMRVGVAEAGFDPDLYAAVDQARDIPYHDVLALENKPGEDVWLLTEGGLKKLSEVSYVFRTLANRAVRHTYACFPAEARPHVEAALKAANV